MNEVLGRTLHSLSKFCCLSATASYPHAHHNIKLIVCISELTQRLLPLIGVSRRGWGTYLWECCWTWVTWNTQEEEEVGSVFCHYGTVYAQSWNWPHWLFIRPLAVLPCSHCDFCTVTAAVLHIHNIDASVGLSTTSSRHAVYLSNGKSILLNSVMLSTVSKAWSQSQAGLYPCGSWHIYRVLNSIGRQHRCRLASIQT